MQMVRENDSSPSWCNPRPHPDEYRPRGSFAPNSPMVAPDYAAQRSEFAKSIGLGARGRGRNADTLPNRTVASLPGIESSKHSCAHSQRRRMLGAERAVSRSGGQLHDPMDVLVRPADFTRGNSRRSSI